METGPMSAENRENDRAAEATERKSRGSSDEAGLHSNAEGRVAEDDDDVDGASLGGAAGASVDGVDSYSIDSASSVGGLSRASLDTASTKAEPRVGSTSGDGNDDDVNDDSAGSSDVGLKSVLGVDQEGRESPSDDAVGRPTTTSTASSSSRSSPESDASSSASSAKEVAFSKDGSPNDDHHLAPRPRRRTVSFIEDHRGPEGENTARSSPTPPPRGGADGEDLSTPDARLGAAGGDDAASVTPWEAKMFRVAYLGNKVMDRRYPSDLQPWVMAELRRDGKTTPVALSAISGGGVWHGPQASAAPGAVQEPIMLRAVSEMDSSILFEHDMSCISRFVRLHTDKLCFAFMTKNVQNVEMPYSCYAFLGYNEEVVPALFNLVRKCALLSSSSADMRLRSGSCSRDGEVVGDGSVPSRPLSYDNFEVQFCGRLRVSGHKGPDTLIDDCLVSLESKLKKKRNKLLQQQQQQQRSEDKKEETLSSDAEKNQLNVQPGDRIRRSGAAASSSSQPNAVQPTDTESTQNTSPVLPADGQVTEDEEEFVSSSEVSSPPNKMAEPRAIIFQVGVNDILITDPTTGSVEAKNYEQISKCQTGLQAVDHFGFIWREQSISTSPSGSIKRVYFVYVFKGTSELVVNEIMLKLHQSFSALHAQRTQARAVTCELCPMHQLHKLCREVEGLEAEKAIGVLVSRIKAQDEEDVELIVTRYKKESPKANDPQDHLEVLMSVLRHVCQQKQAHHVHIAERRESASSSASGASGGSSGSGGSHATTDFILDAPARRVSTADKVSHFFNKKVRRTLKESFDELVKGGEAGEKAGSTAGNSRRPSIQQLVEMTDSFSSTSDDHASNSSAQWGPFKGPNSPPAKDGTPFSSKPVDTLRPGSNTLDPKNIPMFWRKSEKANFDPTASIPTTTTENETALDETTMDETTADEASIAAQEDDFEHSPRKRIYERTVGRPGSGLGPDEKSECPSRKSSVDSETPESGVFLDDSPSKTTRNRQSFRQSLWMQAVTPVKGESESESSRRGSSHSIDVCPRFSVSAGNSRRPSANVEGLTWITSPSAAARQQQQQQQQQQPPPQKRSSEELRDLWRSAITQQILLNKMERQNSQLAKSQDKAVIKRERLLYEELTPCLKSVTSDWDQALASASGTPLPHSQLRDLVRRGVPRAKRGAIWKFLIQQEASKPFRPPNAADSSVDADIPFGELMTRLTGYQHAILIDLARTFPNHPYFNKQLGPGQLSLFNLLKAYSLIDTSVGYCQGLSFVAGILLMHLEEEESFDAMKYLLITTGLRHQYCPEMTALQVQMYQFSRLIHDHHPKLSKRLDSFEMSPTLFAASWFLTLFASQFPLGFVARVFDLVFLEGIQAIFKVAVSLLGQHLALLLECDSFESLVEFLKTTLPALSTVQVERVIGEAFELEEDISKYLNAYQIEYHIFQEELAISPGGSTGHTTLGNKVVKGDGGDEATKIVELEKANRNLKHQNLTLLEQLQAAHATIDHYANVVKDLNAKVVALEGRKERKLGDETIDSEKTDLEILLNNNNDFRASVG